MARAERGEPTPDRPRRRELAQPAEAEHERIPLEVAQVAEPAPAAEQQREHDEHQPDDAVVRRGECRRQLAPQQRDEAIALQPAPHELQAGVGGEASGLVAQGEWAVDAGTQFGFSSSHRKWPFVVVGFGRVVAPYLPHREAFSASAALSSSTFSSHQG